MTTELLLGFYAYISESWHSKEIEFLKAEIVSTLEVEVHMRRREDGGLFHVTVDPIQEGLNSSEHIVFLADRIWVTIEGEVTAQVTGKDAFFLPLTPVYSQEILQEE